MQARPRVNIEAAGSLNTQAGSGADISFHIFHNGWQLAGDGIFSDPYFIEENGLGFIQSFPEGIIVVAGSGIAPEFFRNEVIVFCSI